MILRTVIFFIIGVKLCVNGEEAAAVAKFIGQNKKLFDEGHLKYWATHNDEPTISCRQDIELWKNSLPKSMWALQMVDASGKIPHGILVGNLNSFGSSSACTRINHHEDEKRVIKGKYCIAKFPIKITTFERAVDAEEDARIATRIMNMHDSQIIYKHGICMPHSCSAKELQNVLQSFIRDSTNITTGNVTVSEGSCVTDEPEPWRTQEIVGCTFFACFAVLVLISTISDVWYQTITESKELKTPLVFKAFSLYSNSKRLTTFGADPGPLGCVHGMKAISMIWIVLGHRYGITMITPMENNIDVIPWTESYKAMIIMASTVSVDTFLVISGVLLSYVFFRSTKAKGFIQKIPIYYFHRYLRLTPPMAFVIIFQVTLANRFLNGINKEFLVDMFEGRCKRNWWINFLYIQNYLRSDDICMLQTWYLGVDMQLYLLSPLILYPILRNSRIGIPLTMLWIFASQSTVFAIAFVNQWWGGSLTPLDPNNDSYSRMFYRPTHTRATPWLIGIVVGYYLRQYLDKANISEDHHPSKKTIIRNRVINMIGWIIALSTMALVLFGMSGLQQLDHTFSFKEDTVYLAFSRTAWSVAIIYIIVSCFLGYGGPINWFLSLKIFQFLSRISFSMYLIHMLVQGIQVATISYVTLFDHSILVYFFMGDLFITAILGYIMTLCFESPITVLENFIFKRK